tara:strand:- start:319 stop:501 length:183 start_codon:yes stop_codon:yes gene_type:complete
VFSAISLAWADVMPVLAVFALIKIWSLSFILCSFQLSAATLDVEIQGATVSYTNTQIQHI